jgi:hypothetical protein
LRSPCPELGCGNGKGTAGSKSRGAGVLVQQWGALGGAGAGEVPTEPVLPFSQDEYQFCYQAALEYLGSFDHYAT